MATLVENSTENPYHFKPEFYVTITTKISIINPIRRNTLAEQSFLEFEMFPYLHDKLFGDKYVRRLPFLHTDIDDFTAT